MFVIAIGFALLAMGAIFRIVATAARLLIGLATHPIATVTAIIHAIVSLAAGCSLLMLIAILALCDRNDPGYTPALLTCIGMTVLCSATAAVMETAIRRPEGR